MITRRTALKLGGLAAVGALTTACPLDGVTKDKAVRYSGIAIGYLKDILPIAGQLGGTQVIELVEQAVPTLEKLKEKLEDGEFSTAGNLFDTVTTTLGQVATALLQLPASARRDTIMGILTLVQVTLRTVSLFIDSTVPVVATTSRSIRAAAAVGPLRKAFEATRF